MVDQWIRISSMHFPALDLHKATLLKIGSSNGCEFSGLQKEGSSEVTMQSFKDLPTSLIIFGPQRPKWPTVTV